MIICLSLSDLLHSFVVELLNYVWLFVTPWTAECQASLSFTTSQSLLKLKSIESVMPSHTLSFLSPPAFSLYQHQLYSVGESKKEWICIYAWASLVAQLVKNPPAMQETWVWSLGWKDLLEEGMATHSSILAWRIPIDRAACTPWGGKDLDMTEQLSTAYKHICISDSLCCTLETNTTL